MTPTRSSGSSAHADTTDDAGGSSRWPRCSNVTRDRLDLSRIDAATSRDRQLVAIARAHLDGDGDLVDALARDHLVDYPDSLIVAWIASDAVAARAARRP